MDAAVKKGLRGAAIIELLLALPPQRSSWDFAAALGDSVNASYWKDAIFFAHNQRPEDIEYGIGQMVDADRAPEVVERIASDSAAIYFEHHPSRPCVLRRKPHGQPVGTTLVMFQWGVARLFTRLEADNAVSAEEIAQLEWLYLAVLEHSERPAKTLHHFMSSRPEILCRGAFGSIPCLVERILVGIHAHPAGKGGCLSGMASAGISGSIAW